MLNVVLHFTLDFAHENTNVKIDWIEVDESLKHAEFCMDRWMTLPLPLAQVHNSKNLNTSIQFNQCLRQLNLKLHREILQHLPRVPCMQCCPWDLRRCIFLCCTATNFARGQVWRGSIHILSTRTEDPYWKEFGMMPEIQCNFFFKFTKNS